MTNKKPLILGYAIGALLGTAIGLLLILAGVA
jgi:hypothetical protein